EPSVVRTRGHAQPTPDAPLLIDEHDPLGCVKRGSDRTDVHAGCVLALHAGGDQEVAVGPGSVAHRGLVALDPLLAVRHEPGPNAVLRALWGDSQAGAPVAGA